MYVIIVIIYYHQFLLAEELVIISNDGLDEETQFHDEQSLRNRNYIHYIRITTQFLQPVEVLQKIAKSIKTRVMRNILLDPVQTIVGLSTKGRIYNEN